MQKHKGFQPNFKQPQAEASAAEDPKVLLAPREEGEHGVWGVPLMGQGRASQRMHEGPAHTNTHCSSSSCWWCAAAIHRHSPAGAAMGSPASGGRERVV